MLLILLIILDAYNVPIIPFARYDKKLKKADTLYKNLLKNQHIEVSMVNNDNKEIIGMKNEEVININNENIAVLNKEDELQKNADSKVNYDDITSDLSVLTSDIGRSCEYVEDTVSTEVMPEYSSKLVELSDNTDDKLTISVPVILSKFQLEFDLKSEIKLDCPGEDIKSVNKDVYLNQCKLIPDINKLFISGYVKESIEYLSIKDCEQTSGNSIRYITADIPFKFTTAVTYFHPPVINYNKEQIEIDILTQENMNNNLLDKEYINSEYLNDKIYCKLISSHIHELKSTAIHDEQTNCNEFKNIKEQMSVKLTLELLQEQEVGINK